MQYSTRIPGKGPRHIPSFPCRHPTRSPIILVLTGLLVAQMSVANGSSVQMFQIDPESETAADPAEMVQILG